MTKEEDMKRDEGFTPGPWVAETLGSPRWTIHPPNSPGIVAQHVRTEADARLIAAAPDLYAALVRLLAQFGTSATVVSAAVLYQAKDALRKATSSLSAAERNGR